MVRILLALGCFGLAAAPAFAHKLLVTVTVTELAATVEAKYEDGEPVPAGARFTLTDKHGTAVSDGVTDESGECRLPRPPEGFYTATVEDAGGHRGELVFTVREGETTTASTADRNRWIAAAI